jgi:2-polyprenyl-3-methyl-5-hydroxy-6-metoxy-1,4-benzoquinol methylase
MDFVVNEFNGYIPRQKWFVNKIIFSTRGLTLDIGCGIGLWSKKLREKKFRSSRHRYIEKATKICKS